MICRAVADLDDVLALGFQREILEESRHAVHLGDRNAKLARDQLQIALAEIAVLRLNILKNRDQRGLAATMLVDDLHDLCALRFVHLLFPPYITDFTVFTVNKKRAAPWKLARPDRSRRGRSSGHLFFVSAILYII